MSEQVDVSIGTGSDWMPNGMVDLTASDSYGPDLNDIRYAPFSSGINENVSGVRDFFKQDYETLMDYLKNAENSNIEPIWKRTDKAYWDSASWARNHVLSVAEFMTNKDYNYKHKHVPYSTDSFPEKGIDCSNYTTLAYNFATGYRFTSDDGLQSGQSGDSDSTYDTPNQQTKEVRLQKARAAGKLVRENGMVDGQSSNTSSPFISVFNKKGAYWSGIRNNVLEKAMRPGDLMYFCFKQDHPKQVSHAAIWTGKRIGWGENEIPPERVKTKDNKPAKTGLWTILESGSKGLGPCIYPLTTSYIERVWGVRRVISDFNDPGEFMNSTYYKKDGEDTYTRFSDYKDRKTAVTPDGDYIFRIKENYITRRQPIESSYQQSYWGRPNRDGQIPETLVGLVIKWGWLFAADANKVYKHSYVGYDYYNAGEAVHWNNTQEGASIISLEDGDSGLDVNFSDNTMLTINLAGEIV